MPPLVRHRCAGILHRGWSILLLVALASISAAAILSATFCHWYWGYILAPPPVHPRVLQASSLRSASTMYFLADGDARLQLLEDVSRSLDLTAFASARDGDGAWRLVPPRVDAQHWLEDWRRRGVFDDQIPSLSGERRVEIPELIESTARLTRGSYGTGLPSMRASIHAYELSGLAGEPLLFLAVRTGEIDNDHLSYYELLYDATTSPPTLIDRRHWRFDVAGIEGLEFVAVTLSLSVLFLIITIPPTAAVITYNRFSASARIRRGHCPRCNYDLVSSFDRGCSECGWGIGDARAPERDLRQYRLTGRFVNLATRAPGWLTIILLAIAALLICNHTSSPGGNHTAPRLAWLLLLLGALTTTAKFVGIWSRPAWLHPHPRRLIITLRFSFAFLLLSLAALALRTDFPLDWRFALSRPALERAALRAQSDGFPSRAPVGMNSWAGLYQIGGIAPTTDPGEGMIIWVGGAGGRPVMRSFVWYPNGRPASPAAYRAPIKLQDELAPGWFLWNYDRR